MNLSAAPAVDASSEKTLEIPTKAGRVNLASVKSIALKLVLIALGLGVGSLIGGLMALYFGLVDFAC